MQTLRDEIKDEIKLILDGAHANKDMSDDLCDELGDYYNDSDDSDDSALQQAYELVRDGIDEDSKTQALFAQQALDLLN